MHVDLWAWGAFVAFILAMLALDLFVIHRDAHSIGMGEAAAWTAVWSVLGLAFGLVVWLWMGPTSGGEYLAGYLIERSLSIDNIFLFALVFGYFAVPAEYQHRTLFWGVLGALVFRAIFIAAGATLLESFHWVAYVFGAFLVLTGVRMWRRTESHADPARNPILRAFHRIMPVTDGYEGRRMMVRRAGKLVATPLLAVLIVVETTDVVFAIDSIPAIFSVTKNTFLIFTSNAFAILGLRAMYFLLAGMIDRFRYLKHGLSAVLVLVGVKMLLADVYEPPIWMALVVIAAVIGTAVVASLIGTAASADHDARAPGRDRVNASPRRSGSR